MIAMISFATTLIVLTAIAHGPDMWCRLRGRFHR